MKNNDWTGERLETNITSEIMLEHLHRYAIAIQIIKEQNILDIACGEGYGTNILAKYAKHITGIDIDENTIAHAGSVYNAQNICFKTGSILNIPEADNNFDIVICFETLEHVADHYKAMSEIKRVLKPDGILILSTPDKKYYSDENGFKNMFHLKELYEEELKALINDFFLNSSFYSQSSYACSVILKDGESNIINFLEGNYKNIDQSAFNPRYRIAIASDKEVPILQSGIFSHKKSISELLFDEAEEVKKTTTYKIGKIITTPIKAFLRLIKK